MKKILDISCITMITLSLLGVCMYENTNFWNFFYFARTDLFIVFLLCFIYRVHKSPYVLSGIMAYVSYLVFDFGTLLGWSVFDFLLKLSLTLILSTTLILTLWHIYRKR